MGFLENLIGRNTAPVINCADFLLVFGYAAVVGIVRTGGILLAPETRSEFSGGGAKSLGASGIGGRGPGSLTKRATPYTAAATSNQKEPFVIRVTSVDTGIPQKDNVVCGILTNSNSS